MCKINGKKLGEERRKAGMTQEEMAKAVGVSNAVISSYERNVCSPSDETVDKICLLLHINKNEVAIQDVGYSFLDGESKTIHNVRSSRDFVRFSTPSQTEDWVNNHKRVDETTEKQEVQNALKNSFGIGSKKYILIDPTFIHIPDWQRDTDWAKATEIAENFNDDKFDPIKVYITKEGTLKVADGAHRIIAFIKNKELKILVEVLGCTEHEAILTFLGQQSGRKTMTVADTYRAGIKANIEEYVCFKDLFESYNIQITAEEKRLENPIGEIRPSKGSLRIANRDAEMTKSIIELILGLSWHGSEQNVFTMRNFKVLRKFLSNHGEEGKVKLLKYCKGAVFYESKIHPVKSNAEMYDVLVSEINK